MFRIDPKGAIILLIVCAGFAGCRGNTTLSSQTPSSGTAPVVLALTDTPPTNVSILSAEVTLSGVTLNPGNVSLLASPAMLELTRLQTDVAYLSTTSVNAGSYTSVTLTFANPSLTIENDTASPIVSGSTTCNVGAICTIAPTTTANLSTTITLPTLTISANTGAGLLVDVNLDNLLSSTLGADFKAGTTVSPFTPQGSGAPLVGAEDVVGQVMSIDTVHNTFSLQNAMGLFSLTVDNTTAFLQFPATLCTTSVFTCLRGGQILSVDIGIRSDGTPLARNVLFEDADSSDTEVEGIITSTNLSLRQFTIVTLAESATISGLKIGDTATVQYSDSPQTPFEVDSTYADNVPVDTSCCMFNMPADLSVGQQVSVRRNSLSGSVINADRVRLRSSRITATVQSVSAPYIYLYNLPSLFSGHSVTQIQVQTSIPTILSENGVAIVFTQIPLSSVVSVRGPLFNVSGARTLVATKVVVKP
jgi:hypothetical protein